MSRLCAWGECATRRVLAGHSVIVIEHDLIAEADWVLDFIKFMLVWPVGGRSDRAIQTWA